MQRTKRQWGPDDVRALRQVMGWTQQTLAVELGVRQQTVSEWETGLYRPRGASLRVLDLVAERAPSGYRVASEPANDPASVAGEAPISDAG